MAEEVVENIRLNELAELLRLPDPPGDRKAAIGEMIEKHIVGDQARHGDKIPASRGGNDLIGVIKTRNTARGVEFLKSFDELFGGVSRQQRFLALVKEAPALMLLFGIAVIGLIDRVVGAHMLIVAAKLMARIGGEGVGGLESCLFHAQRMRYF